MKKRLKRISKWIMVCMLLFLAYTVYSVVSGTIYDFQPPEVVNLDLSNITGKGVIGKDTLSLLSWNIGFAALGEKSLMFYDQGKTFFSSGTNVREPKVLVDTYLDGIQSFLRRQPVDFILLQEVDVQSKRSHYINQYEQLSKVLDGYSSSLAYNYRVDRVPIPVFEPWNVTGGIQAGIATFSKYDSHETKRLQLPGNYDWPKRIYHLDRCLAKHRYKLVNGKELIVINLHNSAYDEGGFIKRQQTEYLRDIAINEYSKGNYVVVGGDWNQSPPGADLDKVYSNGEVGRSIVKEADNFMPSDWVWAFDDRFPSSRKVDESYVKGVNPEKLIDFFLISPNIELLEVETLKMRYQFSDHEPVRFEFRIR